MLYVLKVIRVTDGTTLEALHLLKAER